MLKLLAILMVTASVAVFVRLLYTEISTWWDRRIGRYATWMAAEFESMLENMSTDRAKRIITITILGAAVLGFLLGGIASAGIFAATAYFGPWVVILYQRRRRLEAIDEQLVDTLLLMSNALKSGLSLQQALELVVQEMKPPISAEFRRLTNEIHLGRFVDDALRRLAERVPLEDVRLATDSILILRETGGDLSDTFEVIAHTIVERKKVQGKVKALTAQGMSQGVLVCLMPIAMMLLFSFIDVGYMRPFFTTPIGLMMLTLVFVLDGMGMWLMLKLVKVKV
jgi:tight adherence protein B